MSPDRVCTIIAACCVLHNIAIDNNEPEDEEEEEEDEEPLDLGNNYGGPETGQAVRNHITNTCFWQFFETDIIGSKFWQMT